MNIFERISGWLKAEATTPLRPELEDLRAAIEHARRLKRHENYAESLLALDQAALLARRVIDTSAGVAIALHRADVLIRVKDYDEAESLLNELKLNAEDANQRNHLAYIFSTLGMLAQAQADWSSARDYYEQALKAAQAAYSPGAEGRAQGHLADTYLQENNASYGVYLLREALPKLNTGGDIELSSYFVGRLGEALIATGQEIEGRNLIGRALKLAEHMEYRIYEREWRIVLAGQAMVTQQYDEARKLYEAALKITDTSQPTPQSVLLLCQMSKCALRQFEYETALDYARRAVALCENQTEADDTYIMAQGTLGIALRSMDKNSEALAPLEIAAQHYNRLKTLEADHNQIDILRNLAAAQAETADSETAFATYQTALEIARTQDSRSEIAGTQRDIGILQARRSQPQEAIKSWTSALDIYEGERQFGRVARLYCDIANLRKSLGQSKRAMQDYEWALMALSSVDDPETRGVVLSNAATAYVDQGDIETAESFFVEAIKLAQKSEDRRAEATRRGNYAWFLLSTGRSQRAIAALDYARRQSQDLGLALPYAVQTDNLGLAYDEAGNYENGLTYHRQALTLIEPLHNPHWEAVIRANLGHTLISLNQSDEAAPYFEAALEIARPTEDVEVIAHALNGQARLALREEDVNIAGTGIAEAVTTARRSGSRRLIADALALQSEYQAKNSQSTEAAASWDEAKKLYSILGLSLAQHTPDWLELGS